MRDGVPFAGHRSVIMSCLALIGPGNLELIKLQNRLSFTFHFRFSVELMTGHIRPRFIFDLGKIITKFKFWYA